MEAWAELGSADDLTRQRVLTGVVDGIRICAFATESGIFAVEDRCPHRGGRLSAGLLYEACKVACPDHGWGIDLQTGCVEPPERGAVRTFQVKIEGGAVWVKTA